ncbi:sigma-70 family RNA polymerase sigma factor [Bacillus sp. CGMCC 1.16607]|uniref:sigma-70 family RNA polymerase sigma factor n=1 Tax=Bacillus sp. CGMCC 1.16607 TaxID=3351842 RepID=UPI003628D8F6
MYNHKMQMAKGNAFSEKKLVEELYPGLKRYCRFLSKNKWDGEDLAQEAILKATQVYEPSVICSALLNKIAYHQWIDMIRKREQEVVGIGFEVPEDHSKKKSNHVLDTVMHLIDQLTPKQAVIFLLKEAFRYQAKEIAKLLNTTEMAVKSSLHRAKARINNKETIHTVDTFWGEKEKDLLIELLYQSLQEEDPSVLIDRIGDIPSLVEVPMPNTRKHSASPLNSYCMAA